MFKARRMVQAHRPHKYKQLKERVNYGHYNLCAMRLVWSISRVQNQRRKRYGGRVT